MQVVSEDLLGNGQLGRGWMGEGKGGIGVSGLGWRWGIWGRGVCVWGGGGGRTAPKSDKTVEGQRHVSRKTARHQICRQRQA